MASQQQQQQGQQQQQQQTNNGQVASSSGGGGGAASGSSSSGSGSNSKDATDNQDPQFSNLQKAAQLLSSRANADSKVEQASELSEVLNCKLELSSRCMHDVLHFHETAFCDSRVTTVVANLRLIYYLLASIQRPLLETMSYRTTRHGSPSRKLELSIFQMLSLKNTIVRLVHPASWKPEKPHSDSLILSHFGCHHSPPM
jgi:hypothetical protein